MSTFGKPSVHVDPDWDEQAHQAQEALAASEPACDHKNTTIYIAEVCECGQQLSRGWPA